MTAPDPAVPGLKLGWRPAPRDHRNLRLSAYTPEQLTPPKRVDWLGQVSTWPMYRNDEIGNCEVCACAHAQQALTSYGGGQEHVIDEADVIAAYSAITGYNPATGEPDPGIASLDMLGHWRSVGVGGRKIAAYVEVNVDDLDEVKTALSLTGALLVGIDMPLSSADQFRAGKTWTAAAGARGRAGSWGGHAVHVGAYDSRYLTCTTWGRTQRMTYAFWRNYVAEAFAPISPDWFNAAGSSPTGLNTEALLADLQRITAI